MKGFIHFLRTQGVVGLAIGFILGGAAQDLVKSLSSDLITPFIGLTTSRFGNLATASSTVAGQTFSWGHFVYQIVNLILVALIIYFVIKKLGIEHLDEQKGK